MWCSIWRVCAAVGVQAPSCTHCCGVLVGRCAGSEEASTIGGSKHDAQVPFVAARFVHAVIAVIAAAAAFAVFCNHQLLAASKGDELWSSDLEQAAQGSSKLLLTAGDTVSVVAYTPG